MPFTASHAAAALPFLRTPLVPSALVIGTMGPDLPYFLPFPTGRSLTHAPLGIVTIDLAIGLVVFVFWQLVLRAPVVDLAPTWIRERMPPQPTLPWQPSGRAVAGSLLILVSVIVGTITHLAWDSFTHPGWLVEHVAVLRTQLGPLAVEKWLQYASSVAGLLILAIWATGWARRTAPTSGAVLATAGARRAAWGVLLGVFAASGLIAWLAGIAAGSSPFAPVLVFAVARVSIGVMLGTALLICLGWIYRERRTATTLPSTSA